MVNIELRILFKNVFLNVYFEILYFHSKRYLSEEKKTLFPPLFFILSIQWLNLSVLITERLIGRISKECLLQRIMPYRSPVENI